MNDFGKQLEDLKHIGDWKDGKLVCREDCPSSAHLTPPPDVEANESVYDMVEDLMHDAESYLADYSNKEWFAGRIRTALTTYRHSLIQEDIRKMEGMKKGGSSETRERIEKDGYGYLYERLVGYNIALTDCITQKRESL